MWGSASSVLSTSDYMFTYGLGRLGHVEHLASLPARSLFIDASGSRETATAGSSGTALS